MQRRGTERLSRALWPDGERLNRDLVGRPADVIATAAGIPIDTAAKPTVLVLDGGDPRTDRTVFREKLSPVFTLCVYDDFDDAVETVRAMLDRCGAGHSCGIYSTSEARIAAVAERVRVCRVLVNHSTMTNAGSFSSGVPFTTTLSAGTWGGCSVSGNVTWEQFVNYTIVSRPIPERLPDEARIFGRHWESLAGSSC